MSKEYLNNPKIIERLSILNMPESFHILLEHLYEPDKTSCLVIGSNPSVFKRYGLGDVVENYELVIRVNKGPYPNTYPYVGSKTDKFVITNSINPRLVNIPRHIPTVQLQHYVYVDASNSFYIGNLLTTGFITTLACLILYDQVSILGFLGCDSLDIYRSINANGSIFTHQWKHESIDSNDIGVHNISKEHRELIKLSNTFNLKFLDIKE